MSQGQGWMPVPRLRLVRELRGGRKLLGKLYRLPDGRRVLELACRGDDCQGQRKAYFDARTGEPVPFLGAHRQRAS